jgi:hypothetical protein
MAPSSLGEERSRGNAEARGLRPPMGRDTRPMGRMILGHTMRDEFASYSFLAVAVAGLILLCSGLLTLAFS